MQAVIFDLGGVYFSVDYEALPGVIGRRFPAIPRAAIVEIIHGQIGQAYRLGEVTEREFWQRAQEIAGVPFDAAGFAELWHSSYRLNEDVRAVLLRLREGYRIGALSGNIRERVEFLDGKYGFTGDFDAIVCSYEVGVNKPRPEIYCEILARLGLEGNECVYVDDTPEWLEPARQLGMAAIHFTGARALKRELRALGML